MDKTQKTVLNFTVSSALKSVIGRDLITNDFVAVFELVKNSFDAHANNVDIVFNNNSIFLIDDGKGMNYNDLIHKWLVVAYSAKKEGTEDANQKHNYAGNKGVGRFSCDRIGSKLRLQTKSSNDSEVHVLDIDWGDFEDDSKTEFEKILVNYTKIPKFIVPEDALLPESNGVVLEISGLREAESWDRAKLLKLKRHLSKLINPFGDAVSNINLKISCNQEKAKDLKIVNEANTANKEYVEIVNGVIKNSIFEILKTKTTWLQVHLNGNKDFVSKLVDRGELIYKICEPGSSYPELTDSEFTLQTFYLNMSAKQTFKQRTGVSVIDFGSLFLFRNGFRIFPIGEDGDDYWNIDRKKRQGFGRYLGTRDIVGRIDIAGPESKFKESSSRDTGLIETKASKQLFDYVTNKCLRRLEKYAVDVTWKDAIDKTYDTAQRLSLDENRSNIIELVSKLAGTKEIKLLDYNHDLVNVLNTKSSYFEKSVERLTKLASTSDDQVLKDNVGEARKRFIKLKAAEQEALKIANEEQAARVLAEAARTKQQQLRLEAEAKTEVLSVAYEEEKKRNLFLTSNENRDKDQLESFLHQIVIYTVSARQKAASTLRKISQSDYKINKDELTGSLSEVLESIEKVITTSRFATSANFKLDSTQITADICLYIDQYLSTISTAYNSQIEITTKQTAKSLHTKFTPIELGMVLDNLVSNAKKSRASHITFDIFDIANGVIGIDVEDNGKGLDASIIEPQRIFEKGVTTTRGSGLGLFHSRKQIEKMGGELVLPEDQPKKGFKIVMRLRKT